MYDEEYKIKSKLKFYHIILLGTCLGILLVVNSNYVNNKRIETKLNKEKGDLFNKIIYGRKLDELTQVEAGLQEVEEEEIEVYATDEICSKASQELQNYYNNSATLKDIGVNEGSIECEDREKDYMKALISIVKSLLGAESEEEEEDEGDGQGNGGQINGGSPQDDGLDYRLRNLFELNEKTKTNLITYGKHILPLVVFLAMAFISIIGWIFCCFCCCCNCCCCCCCKKPGCKIPCFIFTYLLYAGVVAICFYGLTQTNKIFTGLSNTECSILRFFDEILFGEMKETRPKWAGIEGINNILSELSGVISSMGPSTYQTLENGLDSIESEQEAFEESLKNAGEMFYDNGYYMDEIYSKDYSHKRNYFSVLVNEHGYQESIKAFDYDDRCILDIIYYFGRYIPEKDEYEPNPSVLYLWDLEYSTIASEANSNLQTAKEGFKDILDDNLDLIRDTLADAQSKLNDLKKPFDNVYDKIATSLYNYANLIDSYGKQGVLLVFGVLALFNIIIAVLMLFLCMCSGKVCVDCCCCRCFCKFFTHILWNILALLMIITFLVGSIIGLVGTIGGDMMSVLSFIMSKENFEAENPVILDKLGGALQYLNCCMNGDGDIAGQLNISGQIGSFDQIYTAQDKIEEAINNFSQVLEIHFAYNFGSEFYNSTLNYTNFHPEFPPGLDAPEVDIPVIAYNPKNITKSLNLSLLIDQLNERIGESKNEKWDLVDGDKRKKCYAGSADDPISGSVKYHPSTCKPNDRDWITDLISNGDEGEYIKKDIINYAQLITDVVEMIENLKDREGTEGSYLSTINNLLYSYQNYLGSFIEVLKDFNQTINSITGILEEYIGNNSTDTFSFLNGKFIGTNLKIVLKFLKYSLGKDLYTVGLCLVIVGCSLIFSISTTILMIVIINVDIDANKEFAKEEQIAEFDTEQDELDSKPRKRRHSLSRRKAKKHK